MPQHRLKGDQRAATHEVLTGEAVPQNVPRRFGDRQSRETVRVFEARSTLCRNPAPVEAEDRTNDPRVGLRTAIAPESQRGGEIFGDRYPSRHVVTGCRLCFSANYEGRAKSVAVQERRVRLR